VHCAILADKAGGLVAYVHLVVVLAVLEFALFGYAVGRARKRCGVPAPATTGNAEFERYFRAHANTLEQLVIFLPALVVFGHYLNAYLAAALGALFVIGRAVYFQGYAKAAEGRHMGFMVSFIPTVILLVGAIYGVVRALIAGG
jgi:glutathione S-transferase